jgi:hypothetical protein
MKTHNILLLVVLLLNISCKSSYTRIGDKKANYIPYYLKVYEADSLFLTNNYEQSYKILDSLFKKFEPINMQNYLEYGNYIASAIMIGKTDNIDNKIRKGILNYGSISFFHPNSIEIKDKIYNDVTAISKEEFESLFLKSKPNKVDANLKLLLIEIDKEDQSARNPVIDYEKMDFFQKKHSPIIEKIIKEYGYPNYQMTKFINDEFGFPVNFTVLFLHQDVEFKRKYLPLLKTLLIKGKVLPNEYASIVDKIYMSENKSLYGTFPEIELLHENKIDSLRKTIGLPKYGYENWANNISSPNLYNKN